MPIRLEIGFEGVTRLDKLGRRLRVATEKQMTRLEGLLYDKVMENVSGKILQKKTGALAASIRQSLDLTGELMTAEVYVASGPGDIKALTLEFGGKGYYLITPVKAQILRFYGKDNRLVFTPSVYHPPSKAFRYLAEALEEVAPQIPSGFAEYIQPVLYGGDF